MGVVATIIQFVTYYLLAAFLSHNIALPLSYLISLAFNFILTALFTFRVKATARKGGGFLASHAVNLTLQMLLLNLFIAFGLDKQLAIIPVFIVCIPVNFILVRLSMSRL